MKVLFLKTLDNVLVFKKTFFGGKKNINTMLVTCMMIIKLSHCI